MGPSPLLGTCCVKTHPQRFPWWREQFEPCNYPQVGIWRTFNAVNELTGNGAVTMELTILTHSWFTPFKSLVSGLFPLRAALKSWPFSAALAAGDDFGLQYQHEKLQRLCPPASAWCPDITTIMLDFIQAEPPIYCSVHFNTSRSTCLPTCLDPLGGHRALRPQAEGKLHDCMENTNNVVEFCCHGNRSSNQQYGTSDGGRLSVVKDAQSSVFKQ